MKTIVLSTVVLSVLFVVLFLGFVGVTHAQQDPAMTILLNTAFDRGLNGGDCNTFLGMNFPQAPELGKALQGVCLFGDKSAYLSESQIENNRLKVQRAWTRSYNKNN